MPTRPPFVRVIVFLLAVVAVVTTPTILTTSPARSQTPPVVEQGRDLFIESCASCHGLGGTGTERGPSLLEAGAAAADFQLRTGRMPLTDPDAQTVRKPPAFEPDEIDALVAYVASLGNGPAIPDVGVAGTDVSAGQQLFVANCAPCHGATANGGAAGPDALAPSLHASIPLDIAEAIITGPGEMPRFGFSLEERNDIIRYVTHLQTASAPGGADIGGIGPVPEGFVGWGLGTIVLGAICYVLGTRRRRPAVADDGTPDGGAA